MIHIFYRATSNSGIGEKCRPNYFSLEKCFKNFLDTLNINKTKLTVMFDGDIENNFILKYKEKYNFDICLINAGSDAKSGEMTLEHIKNQPINNDDIIYILEQDYLHLPWVEAVEFIYKTNPIQKDINDYYIVLYDHKDKYMFNRPFCNSVTGIYSDLKSQIYLTPYGYVRTTPNTCASFLLNKQLFDKDYEILKSCPPTRPGRGWAASPDFERFEILREEPRNRVILSFMPGLSTHMHSDYISPFINWQEVNNKTILL